MKKFATLLLLIFILPVACIPAPVTELSVNLATPTDESEVNSLNPFLSWSGLGGATSYRLQVASDSNFQKPVYYMPGCESNYFLKESL